MGEAVEPYAPKQPFIRCLVCSLVSLVHTPSMGTAWQLFTWGSNTTTLAKAKGSGQVSGGMSTRLTNSSLMIFGVTDKCQLKNVIFVQVGFRFFQVCLSRSDYNKHFLLFQCPWTKVISFSTPPASSLQLLILVEIHSPWLRWVSVDAISKQSATCKRIWTKNVCKCASNVQVPSICLERKSGDPWGWDLQDEGGNPSLQTAHRWSPNTNPLTMRQRWLAEHPHIFHWSYGEFVVMTSQEIVFALWLGDFLSIAKVAVTHICWMLSFFCWASHSQAMVFFNSRRSLMSTWRLKCIPSKVCPQLQFWFGYEVSTSPLHCSATPLCDWALENANFANVLSQKVLQAFHHKPFHSAKDPKAWRIFARTQKELTN